MIATIILARVLPTSEFAAFAFFQMTVAMLANYAAMGLGATATRFFSDIGREDVAGAVDRVGALWFASLGMSAAAVLLILVAPSAWFAALGTSSLTIAVGVFAVAVGVVPAGAIPGLEQYRAGAFVSAFHALILVAGAAYAALLGSAHLAIGAVVLAAVVQSVGNSVLVLSKIGIRRARKFVWRASEVNRVISFAGPMVFVTLLASSGSWLVGRIILSATGGEYAFSLYAIGMQWFALALLLPSMVARVVLPRIVKLKDTKNEHAHRRVLVRRAAQLSGFTAIALSAVCVAISPWLIRMYGDKFSVGASLVAAFMIAGVLMSPANVIGNAIIAHDRQRDWLKLIGIWFLVLLLSAAVARDLHEWTGAVAQAVAALVLTGCAALYGWRQKLI